MVLPLPVKVRIPTKVREEGQRDILPMRMVLKLKLMLLVQERRLEAQNLALQGTPPLKLHCTQEVCQVNCGHVITVGQ